MKSQILNLPRSCFPATINVLAYGCFACVVPATLSAATNQFQVDFIEINLSNTPPLLVSTTPADGATGVDPAANFVATFDEPVSLNTIGSVTIKNLTTATDTVISLPGPDPDGTLSVTGNQLTIDPTVNPGVPGNELVIEISADAIKDADDACYAGILSTDDPNWSFTIDNTPPVPSYFHPIPATANYSVFFDDNVTAFTTGSFTWSRANENSISFSSNLTLTDTTGERHALFDNLQIRTLGSGGGSGFEMWKTTNNATGGLDGDHDGDGVPNGVEYFIGGPTGITTGFTPLPGITNIGGTLRVTWTKAGTYTGTHGPGGFEVNVSSTLAADSWSAAATNVTPNVANTGCIDGNNVTCTFSAGTKNFARLAITGP